MRLRSILPRSQRAAGFSMIELLTVIFLIAFMLSFLTYAMLNYMKVSKVKAARAQLQRLSLALTGYYSDMHVYPPDSGYGLPTAGGTVGGQTLYDAGGLYRYLGRSVHWLKTTPTGTVDMGTFGPYMKFETWELKPLTDSPLGDSFQIIDPWGSAVGYIGDPARKIHNRDGVDLFSAGPDKKTASDDPAMLKGFPPNAMNGDNVAYTGQDANGDGIPGNAPELGHAILNGCLTQFLNAAYKKTGAAKAADNTPLDDINNWDPEN
jgi:type II secretory pathway pseudopilin PulG